MSYILLINGFARNIFLQSIPLDKKLRLIFIVGPNPFLINIYILRGNRVVTLLAYLISVVSLLLFYLWNSACLVDIKNINNSVIIK